MTDAGQSTRKGQSSGRVRLKERKGKPSTATKQTAKDISTSKR